MPADNIVEQWDEPCFFDFGWSSDPWVSRFLAVPEMVETSASVLAIDFTSLRATGSRLILQFTLWAGKTAVLARGLIDSGSEDNFIKSDFFTTHTCSICFDASIQSSVLFLMGFQQRLE